MTTTAHEDQFTAAPEPVREPYDTSAIMRRNVAALEVALKQQTERAEAAEAELARLHEQAPAGWVDADGDFYHGRNYPNVFPTAVPVYATPTPAPAVPYGVDEEAANRIALAVYDCKHGINQEPLLYAINRILAAEAHPLSVEGRDALLQSAPQAPAVPELDPMTRLIVSDPKQLKPKKQEPAVPSVVFMAHNKTSSILFAARKDADQYAASFGPAAGVSVTECAVIGSQSAPQAPAVPAGCVAHLAQLADDHCQCHCCRTKRRKARALLQSAEVIK